MSTTRKVKQFTGYVQTGWYKKIRSTPNTRPSVTIGSTSEYTVPGIKKMLSQFFDHKM
jgi:hypothetical protein